MLEEPITELQLWKEEVKIVRINPSNELQENMKGQHFDTVEFRDEDFFFVCAKDSS